jgi:hypothetical protein
MIRRVLNIAIVLIAAAVTLTSCFKDEVQGTLFKIAVYSKNVEEDDFTKTKTELQAYAFSVQKGSKWEVKTWEDALNKTITHKDNGTRLTEPDVIGTWNPDDYYQLTLDLRDEVMFMVVVDVENQVYATRLYETPMNWPETKTELHLYAYKKSGSANGWDMVNPFPEQDRDSLIEGGETETEDEDVTE